MRIQQANALLLAAANVRDSVTPNWQRLRETVTETVVQINNCGPAITATTRHGPTSRGGCADISLTGTSTFALMSSAEKLAQELIDAILDFLHDDRESLLSSSLVARKWVPAPRHHIFAERIAINFTKLGPPAYNWSSDTAHDFLALGRSPYCSILPAIRNVVLNVDTELNGASELLQEIVEMLTRSPVNKMLFLDHTFKSSEGQPISLSWIAPHFPGLQEFSYNALHDVVGDVFALVASFPLLQSLAVYSNPTGGSNLARGTPRPAIPHAAFAHLHTLRLRLYDQQSEELLAWVPSIGGQLRLETLDINVFHCYHNGWGPVAALNLFLHANADSLRSFTLRVTYDNKEDGLDDDLRVTKPADGDGMHAIQHESSTTHPQSQWISAR